MRVVLAPSAITRRVSIMASSRSTRPMPPPLRSFCEKASPMMYELLTPALPSPKGR
jgi:hypothetical protein